MISLFFAAIPAFLVGWIMAKRGTLPDYERLLRTARAERDAQEARHTTTTRLYADEMRKMYACVTETRRERDLYQDLWKGVPLAETRWSRAGKPLPGSLTGCLKGPTNEP
jgi:hypothetical protein